MTICDQSGFRVKVIRQLGLLKVLNSSQPSPTYMGMIPVSLYSTHILVFTSLMYCNNSSDLLVRFTWGCVSSYSSEISHHLVDYSDEWLPQFEKEHSDGGLNDFPLKLKFLTTCGSTGWPAQGFVSPVLPYIAYKYTVYIHQS